MMLGTTNIKKNGGSVLRNVVCWRSESNTAAVGLARHGTVKEQGKKGRQGKQRDSTKKYRERRKKQEETKDVNELREGDK